MKEKIDGGFDNSFTIKTPVVVLDSG